MQGCARCGSSDLVRIELTIRGDEVTFAHCRHCEHRTWLVGEQPVALEEVLGRVAG